MVRNVLSGHQAIAIVICVAAALRLLAEVGYWPASYFSDSYTYLRMADTFPVGTLADRPSGYPLLVKVLSLNQTAIGAVTVAQHVAGLISGALLYVLLLRSNAPKWIAVSAAALVLLDGYAIALEQFILAEAFFGLAIFMSFFLVAGRNPSGVQLAASGLLLAVAVTIRTPGLFAVPIWGLYLLWTYRPLPRLGWAAAGFLVPMLIYGAAYSVNSGAAGLSVADGWFLYGRVGEIADCRLVDEPVEARPLCERDPERAGKTAVFYIWNAQSPAVRRYGFIRGPSDSRQHESNEALKAFAMSVIRDRPGAYASLVAADFVRYFRPGQMSPGESDRGLYLTRPLRGPTNRRDSAIVGTYASSGIAGAMLDYERLIHTPRWLLGPLALLALLAMVLPGPVRHRPEIFLFGGAALLMLLASSATSGFIVRYMIPAVPLLVCAGALALSDLSGRWAQRRALPRLG